ncbi:nucleoside-diphosphate sugar epimerase [Lysinibacillus sp. LZ02]|uniref:nucleoside-diphosphate sugar epimerase n=1 Tax=Lysinibacillus sp. LZ02 TaxID=3420668 RepID=UPI003D35F893
MLKIKTIEFNKVIYDESLSHNIFSIANITFSNYPPVYGALLYWRKNADDKDFTAEGDYKFFYDMANVTYFASVKFPKHVRLTRDQKQELAYILLEERGAIGSYSFPTHGSRKKNYAYKKRFQELQFPSDFNVKSIPAYIKSVVSKMDLEMILHDYPSYNPDFITKYAKWRYQTAQMHPNDIQQYLPYIDFDVICTLNPYLTESYLIDHLAQVNFEMIASNYQVLNRLPEPFRLFMYSQIDPELAKELQEFLESDIEDSVAQDILPSFEEEDALVELEFFDYDCGANKWPGSEHLVKGIPSLACQLYDQLGYRKCTNKEMDEKFANYSEQQCELISYSLELHWIHRYRDKLNWSIICEYNPHLTEDFLTAHLKYINFNALGNNTKCELSESFMDKHMSRFNHQKPVPLVIRHLTENLYLTHKDKIVVNSELLNEYGDLLDDEQFLLLQNLIEP